MAEVPKSKPLTEDQFKNELDLTAKIIFNKTLPKDDLRITLQEKIKKGEDAGIMSSEEALSFIKDRMEFFKEYAKENPMGDPPPKNFQMGGRVNFLKGGDTKYNAMVTEMYIKLGGKEGTGMDIDTFAEEYFKKFSTGGRVNYNQGSMDPDTSTIRKRVEEIMDLEGLDFGEAFKKALREINAETREYNSEGTMPKSEKWMRDYFFSGKGGYDDRMSYKEFALGPGQELYQRFGKD